ncbi:hypothetical protein [Leptolyngbya sp. CCY15150]|uniref:hypothetical protein n=1 Tax=Leptolyngbya sp. CCY15150 TaxID=2767772 RepID=UPI00194E8A5D|nr:hypothetical protein [Leptolyngbya sp. CCY15150]
MLLFFQQTLIIDEGFGTQDAAGCERLVADIQAIADDFAYLSGHPHTSPQSGVSDPY